MNMCRMGDVCLPGLQGFPVQITGWSSIDKTNFIIPNDIHLQFSPSESPMKFDKDTKRFETHGSNTFFVGGSQYKVYAVRLAAPKQEGLKSFSGESLAELQIWGYNESTSNLAVLTIPYYNSNKTNEQSDAFLNIVTEKSIKLIDLIPDGSGVQIVRYSTCIETNSNRFPTVNIQAAYWSTGVPLDRDTINSIKGIETFSPGIPALFDLKVLTSFTQLNNEARSKADRKYEIKDGALIPYQNSVAISVATKEIQTSFRIITKFSKGKQTPTRKWIPIDPEKDVKNGYLLINPESGERLDSDETPEEARKNEIPEVNVNPPPVGNIWRNVCIILGILLGCLVIYGIYAIIGTYLLDRKTQHLPPLDPTTAKLQATLPEGLVGK